MKLHFRSLVSIALSAALLLGCVGCGGAPKAATTITVWTYYSGDQLTSFNELVDEFNSTVGQEKHIVVKSSSQGSVTDLETNVLAAAKGEVGAAALPNIYSGYADMAYDLDQLGEVVDLAPYLTDKEKAAYVDGFLKEGDLMNNGELKVFPVAKSTELFYLNATDWAPFAAATGVTYDDLATVEGVTEAAHKYYDWTDAQTDTPNDGKAFFGRDALANYLFCGAQELGVTIFDAENGVMTLNLDKDVMRKLWDNYYVPFLKGWFGASGRFRSDDVKTGNLLSYVGSSSSSTFFPKQVLTSDTESHDIEMAVLPCPSFSVSSGYLPVTHAAASLDAIRSSGLELSDSITTVLGLSLNAVENDHLYTTHAFPEGSTARNKLQYAMEDAAEADRATVEERIAAGQTPEEAEAEFLTDDYFDQWYEATRTTLEAFAG